MGIDFTKTFGAPKAAGSNAASSNADRPKAKVWLNVGYNVPVEINDGGIIVEEDRFVSLPFGIPLDTMEYAAVTSRNEDYAQFQSAKNDLLDQIMVVANKLQPGEFKTLNLEIQMRRVQDDRAPVSPSENMFTRKLELV